MIVRTLFFSWVLLCCSVALVGCGETQSNPQEPSLEADGGPCTNVSDCSPGAFACSEGRCQLWEASTCPETGLGVPCSFESSLDGISYSGRCTFHGDAGDYYCAPDCTDTPCPQQDSVCHPVQPTGQVGDWKACMPPCSTNYQCLGGTWECNTDGQCVIPNEAACVGKSTLDACSFTGSDGASYEGICSRPPPTIEGPPYYSETNLCVRVCDPEDPATCDRIVGVCQPAEPEGSGNGPGGKDYAVCVAPVCNGDEDCTGGMFGCENEVCVLPSYTACDGLVPGDPCEREVAGTPVEGFCSPVGMCLPSCTYGEKGPGFPGSCVTHPDSSVCLAFIISDTTTRYLCIDPTVSEN